MPLTEYSFNDENAVDRIFYGRIDIKKASSFLFYTEKSIVKNLIHHLKYKKQQQIGKFFGDWYGQLLTENGELNDVDYIIPVPLHKKKLRKRGYNQVNLFAIKLAEHLNSEFLPGILLKSSNSKTQTGKQRTNRWQNSKELYFLKDTFTLSGKHVLLVDDVITTGATIEACASALQKSTGVIISVASMALVP